MFQSISTIIEGLNHKGIDSSSRTKVTFGLAYVFMFVVFARDGINRVGPFLPRGRILEFRENMPQCLKRFWSNLIKRCQNSFYGLCNVTNVRDKRKASSRYLVHRSARQRSHWFVIITRKVFK